MSKGRTPRWRLQRVQASALPEHPAPGLAEYKRRLDALLGNPFALPKLRSSIAQDGIITPLIATGNWTLGTFEIIDGFRRLKIARDHGHEVPLRVYNSNDLHDPADVLRLRVSTHTSSSGTDVLSMALSIYSALVAVAAVELGWSLKTARLVLEDAASNVPRFRYAPSTTTLFNRANVSIGRFKGTLLPMVYLDDNLQTSIFNDELKPSIAKLIQSAPRHAHPPLLSAAQQGASRNELLQLKLRLIHQGPPPSS